MPESYRPAVSRRDCIAASQNRSSSLTTPAFESTRMCGAILVAVPSTNKTTASFRKAKDQEEFCDASHKN
jgi:hypothetical protein